MAGRLWIVNYLEPFTLDKRVDRVLSDTRPPGSSRLVTALVEATDPQVGKLQHQNEVVSLRSVSAPLESTRCVAVSSEGVRCGKPASVPDVLWGGLVCEEHAVPAERSHHIQAARLLLDMVDSLERELDDLLERASTAHVQGERVSVLAAELLLGVHAHLASGKEALQIAKSSLRNGLKEEEAA